MIQVRKSDERGRGDYGWLDTRYSFSFARYHDPEHMGFLALRVMNEDRVAPGRGFGEHPHDNMEIVTYVLSGALEHRDSMGHGEVLRPGEFQRMSAGRGIRHSERNPSHTEPVHLYQIWLEPRERDVEPSYEQKPFDAAGRDGAWQLVASPEGRDGSLTINQDANLFLGNPRPGETLAYSIAEGRGAWLQVLRGELDLNGVPLEAGDGVALSEEPELAIRTATSAEVLLFDLA